MNAYGDNRFIPPSFSNSTLCGVNGQLYAHSDFIPAEETLLLIERETKWAQNPIWTLRNRKKMFSQPEIELRLLRGPAQLLY
jgi:hypothetical protein